MYLRPGIVACGNCRLRPKEDGGTGLCPEIPASQRHWIARAARGQPVDCRSFTQKVPLAPRSVPEEALF